MRNQQNNDRGITPRAFLAGVLFAALFAALTVYFADRHRLYPTATQMPVLPYVLLLLTVLLVNPVCRRLRFVRVFSPAEILIVFVMGLVSSGVSTFGLAAPLVPIVGSLFNRAWNNEQTAWNRHVTPFLNESYFLAEPGLREASAEYAARHDDRQRLRRAVDAAIQFRLARDSLAAAERAARGVPGAREAVRQAAAAWAECRQLGPDWPEADAPPEAWTVHLEAAEARVRAARARLDKLEQAAFEKVDLFRRGLPRHLRAYPGFIKQPEDTLAGYMARFRRMLEGRRVAADIRNALAVLEAAPGPERTAADLAPRLRTVRQRFARMADAAVLRADLKAATAAADRLADEIAAHDSALFEMLRRRREAPRRDAPALDRQIERRQLERRALARRRAALLAERDALQRQTEILLEAGDLERAAAALAEAAEAGRLPDGAAATLRHLLDRLPAIDGSPRLYLVGNVPWHHWSGPLLRWALVIGLTYLVLMTFNVLIFRQWAHHEKLVYPLAELPMFLAGQGSAQEPGTVPQLFRGGLFWTGAAISGIVLGYNAMAATGWIPGLVPLDLRNAWTEYLPHTAFRGLLGGGFAQSHVFFTMIGLAFLIPKKVSFSLWFFAVFSMVQLLALVRLGYGQNEAAFPWEFWYTLNFRSAQGGGALLVFSSVVLFKCRRYLLCALAPGSVRGLPDDERRELRLASLGFVLGSVGLVLAIWLGLGANLFHTVLACFLTLVITVGLIRAVAEGGLLGLKIYLNPLHFIRSFFGLDRAWTASALYAPLMVYAIILFLDIKTFIAPAMANSLKIRDTLNLRRGRFHLAVAAAIAVSAVVAVIMAIMMAYAQGADLANPWFSNSLPRVLFDRIAVLSRAPPAATPGEAGWVVAGAAAMGALLFFRQTVFWLPHPIGLIMLVNPNMGVYWFSILVGWAAKALVTRYGNRATYAQARTLFIGLIVGELFMVAAAMALTVAFEVRIPIDLNR